MQFQVPQFIEVEDKIFGPLTIKQFVYLAGGTGLCVLIYFILPLFIGIFLMIPVIGFSLGLAFYKINNKPFIFVLEAAVMYFLHSKLYIWKKMPKAPAEKDADDALTPLLAPKLSDSKLKDLAWSLDVTDKAAERVQERR
jgi:hypothetical protein